MNVDWFACYNNAPFSCDSLRWPECMDPAFQVVFGPAENITANAVKALAAAHMHKVAQQNNTWY